MRLPFPARMARAASRLASFAIAALAIAALAPPAAAQWAPDGTHLTAADFSQTAQVLVEDGTGGAIAVWVDGRSSYSTDLFGQRIAGDGTLPSGWVADGDRMTSSDCSMNLVSLVADGAGGAVLGWSENRCNSQRDLFAKRITSNGGTAPGFPANGIGVCVATGNQDQPAMVADGAGGAFLAWQDWRFGTSVIFASRVAGAGGVAAGWPTDGLRVCAASADQSLPAVAADGAGGVFVAWQDLRSGQGDIYLQRFDGSGAVAAGWPTDGIAVCAAAGHQGGPLLAADGAGGVLVAWTDHRGADDDLYGTHVDGTGSPLAGWAVDGNPLCTAAGDQRKPAMVPDGAGGALLAWQDHRGAGFDIYALRVAGDGSLAPGFSTNGVALCAAAGDQLSPQLVSDGGAGAIVTWQDARSSSSHIYAQHLTAAGVIAAGWAADGLPLCTAAGTQVSPRIVTDGAGGAIVAWQDTRAGSTTAADIYALRVLPTGPVQTRATGLTALHHDGQTFLTWNAPAGTGWTYRLYRAAQPISQGADLASATVVGSVGDSTWCDRRLSRIEGQFYAFRADSAAAPLASNQGLFVHTPAASGTAWYAVTVQLAGHAEDLVAAPGSNALGGPVTETLAAPRPVYQRSFTVGLSTHFDVYTLWTTNQPTPLFARMGNLPSLPYDCGVNRGGGPPGNSLLLSFHTRESDFVHGIFPIQAGQWVLAMDDPVDTRDENTYWIGFSDSYDVSLWQNPVPSTGTVYDYTLERTLHTLRWMRGNFPVDPTQVYEYGFSAGGIGSLFFALYHPEYVAALMCVSGKVDFSDLDDPNPACGFNTGMGLRDVSDRLWGTVGTNLPFARGGNTYDWLNGSWVAAHAGAAALPPVIAFNGKNDTALGWAEKIPFYAAMDAARQGGMFFWDPREHLNNGTAAWTPMQNPFYLYRFRTNKSFPAISRCSADNDPGDGSPTVGDSVGTVHGFVEWDSSLVDEAGAWQTVLRARDLTTLWGPRPAPDTITADVTPRRLQAFRTLEDSVFIYRVTRLADGAIVQEGALTGDSLNLVTVPAVKIYRSGSQLRIQPLGTSWAGTTDAPSPRIVLTHPAILITPHPVRGAATMRVAWPGTSEARVELFDAGGRRVRTLFQGAPAGPVAIALDGRTLAPGLYFVAATQAGQRSHRRIVVLR